MDYQLAETLQMLIGMGAATVIVISALRYRLRRKELEHGPDRHLADTVDDLRMEIQEMRAEHAEQITELQERVEFAERLLTKGREVSG